MVDQYVIGGFIASVTLGLFLLRILGRKRKKQQVTSARSDQCLTRSENGACQNGSADVILVGAGVVGSALAYSLAKVHACA